MRWTGSELDPRWRTWGGSRGSRGHAVSPLYRPSPASQRGANKAVNRCSGLDGRLERDSKARAAPQRVRRLELDEASLHTWGDVGRANRAISTALRGCVYRQGSRQECDRTVPKIELECTPGSTSSTLGSCAHSASANGTLAGGCSALHAERRLATSPQKGKRPPDQRAVPGCRSPRRDSSSIARPRCCDGRPPSRR
eukprot:scaffold116532_cov75-Phaeocystis_antarctica.AAC.3